MASSAKDKAILEAAYLSNAKPDKAARLDIVKRVSLNEKEVQVGYTIPFALGTVHVDASCVCNIVMGD